ncbi:MAG: hypothetical protein K2M97_05620 [Muribaculaceae bacterium]|nr:hypothetical protein [Muribaculaceae bacterium]
MKKSIETILAELNDEYQKFDIQCEQSDKICSSVDNAYSGNSGGVNYERIRIGVSRFGFGNTSTISRFIANAYDENGNIIETISGYFLEPEFDTDRNTIGGSDTAIPGGTYTVCPALHNQKSGFFEIEGVSGRTAIHIHPGNYGTDTEGCFLPGQSYNYNPNTNEYSTNNSVSAFSEFQNFMNRHGSGYATISIQP